MTERPNTLSGLRPKHAELVRYRNRLEADIRTVTVDIDHLEAQLADMWCADRGAPGRRLEYADRLSGTELAD